MKGACISSRLLSFSRNCSKEKLTSSRLVFSKDCDRGGAGERPNTEIGGLPCPSLKIVKKCPSFGKDHTDCGHIPMC